MQISPENTSKTWESFKSTNDERLGQIAQKGAADPLTEQKLQRINDALDESKARFASIEATLNRPSFEGNCKGFEQNLEYKAALTSYIRKGEMKLGGDFARKALAINSDTDGGFLVDKVTSKQIVKKIEESSVMRKLASIEEISTHVLEVLEDDQTLESGWVNEMQSREDTDTPKINKKRIEVHEIYAQPKATQKLIDDAKIDIANWLAEKISDKFAAVESAAFIRGDGVHKPKGILSFPHGQDRNAIEQINVANTSVSSDDIMNLYYSLHSKYAGKGSFLMHRNMLQTIRMFKCPTTGHYMWAPGLALGQPDTLLGAPVYESSDMPIPASDALAVAFADFKEAYKIVDRTNISIIRDPFTDKPFVKFYATKRVGGDVINTRAIKLLKLSASTKEAKKQ